MKNLLKKIGFISKENAKEVFIKKYSAFDNYIIEVDFEKKLIDYGKKIKSESKTTQNFSQAENWVVLECVDRLLSKGYEPKNIVLEKVYPSGHGTSGRLDVLVKKNNKAYLMIECKTWGKEFDKEFAKLKKDGGQLFTYFQQDTNTEYLVLYTSRLDKNKIEYKNEIVKIEDFYRETNNVKDFYNRWSKLTSQNGIFEERVIAYDFKNKLLTKKELKELSEADSGFIFHQFLSILRKHSVSDKPNAFNKIFNLFLAKIYDEKKKESSELDFQWKEGKDDPVNFQIRLINLHKEGMYEFLKKEIEGIEDSDFNQKLSDEEIQKKKKKWLKFNNIFTLKEVIDDESFDDNQRVLKEVVELLQKYQIRYPRKQQHLSDFFERLLTTGLKQESGQFFTPPPIARYIIKSLPIKEYIKENLDNPTAKLPAVIDYAAGSGHFVTEMMEEYQNIINELDTDNFYPDAIKEIKGWKQNEYSWAAKYIYGIEKDYRLVKVAKVGCYFYGDGLAQVIHGDGLDNFQNSKSYVGLLKKKEGDDSQDNAIFSFVISNPPYSVASFKGDIKNAAVKTSFGLYKYLTDQSKEIECLFVERTKQLLKEGGIAGIILPSSMLSNAGIYAKTREIILKYFNIIGITELGSNTFMATGTNTVILFLKRKNNNDWKNFKNSVDNFFTNFQDITVNGIENIFSKYVSYVWGEIKFSDYVSLCQKSPNKTIQEHEIFKEYKKNLKYKNDEDLYKKIVEIEKEKLLYFILAYKQKVVLTKTGKKRAEKQFLGYEFSNRRGHEGIHPIQRSKSIDECTKLFDPQKLDNPTKASTYILDAFENNFEREINEELKNHISRVDLVDMMIWDRNSFEKNIRLSVKKKIKYESKWGLVKLRDICEFQSGLIYDKKDESNKKTDNIVLTSTNIDLKTSKLILNKVIYLTDTNKYNTNLCLKKDDIFICMSSGSRSHLGKSTLIQKDLNNYYFGGFCGVLRSTEIDPLFIQLFFQAPEYRNYVEENVGQNINNLRKDVLLDFKIPFPPKNIQEKIVKEIAEIEKKDEKNQEKIEESKNKITKLFESAFSKANTIYRISDSNIFDISIGKRVLQNQVSSTGKVPVYSANVFEPFGYIDKLLIQEFDVPSVLWGIDGDWMVNYMPKNRAFYPTDHCGVLRVKDNKIDERYLAYVLRQEGKKLEFSRNKRASIDRIQDIKIKAPSLPEQQKIVTKIEKIEKEIEKLQVEIKQSKNRKQEVLKKYL